MRQKIILMLMILMPIITLNAQKTPQSFCAQKEIDIQEIALKDSFLIEQIEIMMEEFKSKNEVLEDGKGYVVLSMLAPDSSQFSAQYYITPNMTSIKSHNRTAFFYAYTDNYLVLIRHFGYEQHFCYTYSPKSLKKFKKIQDKYLMPTSSIKAYEENGDIAIKDKKFREEYFFRGGKTIYYYHDEKIPPKVIQGDGSGY